MARSARKLVTWTLVEAPVERPELTVLCDLHDYLSVEEVVVRETDAEVGVTVYGRLAPPSGGWVAYEHKLRWRVDLERPLGGRTLLP